MKPTIILLLFLFGNSIVTNSFTMQQNNWTAISDSMALESRAKADIVLSKFGTTPGKKILYSLQNRDYYIIIQSDNSYKEYVVSIDSICNFIQIKEVTKNDIKKLEAKKILSNNKRKLLKRLREDEQTVKEAFNTAQYSKELITSMPNASYIAGVPSYFVMKDEKNNRYGEYCLSSITTPPPINPKLWAYLIKNLIE